MGVLVSMPHLAAVFTVYPDGSLSFCPIRKFKPSKPVPVKKLAESPEWELFNSLPPEGKEAFLSSPLGSSNVSNFKKTSRPRRGAKGITRDGRRKVRFGAAWLQETYGKEHLSFVTLTLPPRGDGNHLSNLEVDGELWSQATNLLTVKLKLDLAAAGLPTSLVGVLEVQEKRQAREGGMPIHYHFTFVGRKPKCAWAISKERIEKLWKDTCVTVFGYEESTSFTKSTNMQGVKRDVSAYLSKYLSKGSSQLSHYAEIGLAHLLPSCWYVMTSDLRTTYKKNLYKFRAEEAYKAVEWCKDKVGSLLAWASDVAVTTSDGITSIVGWAGAIARGIGSFAFRVELMDAAGLTGMLR